MPNIHTTENFRKESIELKMYALLRFIENQYSLPLKILIFRN